MLDLKKLHQNLNKLNFIFASTGWWFEVYEIFEIKINKQSVRCSRHAMKFIRPQGEGISGCLYSLPPVQHEIPWKIPPGREKRRWYESTWERSE